MSSTDRAKLGGMVAVCAAIMLTAVLRPSFGPLYPSDLIECVLAAASTPVVALHPNPAAPCPVPPCPRCAAKDAAELRDRLQAAGRRAGGVHLVPCDGGRSERADGAREAVLARRHGSAVDGLLSRAATGGELSSARVSAAARPGHIQSSTLAGRVGAPCFTRSRAPLTLPLLPSRTTHYAASDATVAEIRRSCRSQWSAALVCREDKEGQKACGPLDRALGDCQRSAAAAAAAALETGGGGVPAVP